VEEEEIEEEREGRESSRERRDRQTSGLGTAEAKV
jgi:hypothetical protein